ncbi:hypothetical protein D3C71_2050410 [compost metagenome]
MSEEVYLKRYDKIYKRFKDIKDYFYKITEENDKKEADSFMRRIGLSKVSEDYNKVQANYNRIMDSKVPF